MRSRWKRRDFLRNTVMASLLAPVAGYWRDLAEAQAITNKRHLVLVSFPNGKCGSNAFIEGTGDAFRFAPGFEPYEEFKSDAIAFQYFGYHDFMRREYAGDGGAHFSGHTIVFSGEVPFQRDGIGLGGMAPTLDQIVAFDHRARGIVSDPLRKSLNIRLESRTYKVKTTLWQTPADYQLDRTYTEEMLPISQLTSPLAGFELMFGDLAQMTGGTAEELRALGRSVLDVPAAELARIRPELPVDGQRQLDRHLQHLRDLEQSLEPSTEMEMITPPAPPAERAISPENHEANFADWIRLIDAAFRLDRTRVASIQIGGTAARFRIPSLGLSVVGDGQSNTGDDHHSYTHWDESRVPLFLDWYARHVSDLLRALKGTESGLPNILRDSAVYCGTEFGANHYGVNVPVTLFGQAGGYFRTGQMVTVGNEITEYHKVTGTLLAIAHAMGLTGLTRIGNPKPEYQQGPWAALRA